MKPFKLLSWVLMLTAGLVLTISACKKDEDNSFNLNSLTAGSIDLNGASSATGVPTDAVVTAKFSTDVDVATATSANITLVRKYDNANIALTITPSGNTITIKANETLGNGTLYELSMKAGLKGTNGTLLTALTRSFTTAGTFAPAGAIAHWNFENNANDVIGSFDPSAGGIVAITYADSRNAAAGKAATFDGDASIIEIPNGSSLMNTTNFTLSFWVKANSTGHVDGNGNPTGHFVMGLGAFKGFQFEITDNYSWCKLAASYELADGTTASEDLWFPGDGKDKDNGGWQGWDFVKDLTASGGVEGLIKDKWAHVVCTYDGAAKKGTMYINGEKMKSFDFNLWPAGDAKLGVKGMKYGGVAPEVVDELAFGFIQSRAGTLWDTETWGGYDFPTSKHFKGSLDDVRIWHKTLTANEVSLMYNSEK